MTDDAASGSDSKRARLSVANPYLKKPAATRQSSVDDSTSEGATSSVASMAVSAPQHAQNKQDDEQTKPAAVETNAYTAQEKQTFGEKDSAVDRLPSQNVSFGSAEILTVSELQKHAHLYVNRSVRITGVVLHRHVANDGNVCLVLNDPSLQKSTAKAPPRSILKTPGGGIKRRLSGSVPRFVTRKRPLSSLKKPPPPPPVNAIDSIVTSLMEQSSVLAYAVSKQMPVNDVAVGDLVMIIGEVKTAPVDAVQSIIEKWNEKTMTTNSFLYARILRNVNGTDMRLHDEALRMRRLHLLETCASEEGETLRPGCGPPPYYNKMDESKEMDV